MVGDPRTTEDRARHFVAYRCDHCGVLSIASVNQGDLPRTKAPNGVSTLRQPKQHMELAPEAITWEPNPPRGQDYPDVPEHIASAADEAHRDFSIRSYRSSILMARSVVEATAKHKGIEKGTLASKIDQLRDQEHVRPMVAETAHEIRFVGNDMAHGDFVAPIDLEEAEDVLHFMDELLNEVYQAPARLNARRSARKAKSSTQE